jgi:hypothetical protein
MLRDRPEIQQVMVIEPLHSRWSMSVFSKLHSDR